MRRYTPNIREKRCRVLGLTIALAACVSPGFAQTSSLSVPAQASGAKEAPSTLTLKDALALAEKNDPAMLAATSDALSAGEDRKQARAALYPSLSGRSEYLGTQGNGNPAPGTVRHQRRRPRLSRLGRRPSGSFARCSEPGRDPARDVG